MESFFNRRILKKKQGFTLIEIIVAMIILSIVSVGLLGNFFSSPPKARDAKRKASLKQVQNALELYYSDYNSYPDESSGQIYCESQAKAWGTEFECDADNSDTYMKKLPIDPSTSQTYFYEQTQSGQGYKLYAKLENLEDSCFDTDYCQSTGFSGTNCGTGSGDCNYVVTSPTETP